MTQLAALLAPKPFMKRTIAEETFLEFKIIKQEKLCYLVKPKKKVTNAKK